MLQYARLVRLPNLPTAIADAWLGCWLANSALSIASSQLLAASAISASLYASGMVWNDVFDRGIDRTERPFRPLPSGAIGVASAVGLASALMIAGLAVSLAMSMATFVVSLLLCLAILGYDGLLKSTWAGPLVMGLCRLLNLLVGLTVGLSAGEPTSPWLALVGIPIANGIYVVGLTWFARREAGVSDRQSLLAATLVVAIGWGMHGVLISSGSDRPWPAVLALVLYGGWLASRVVPAIRMPTPPPVQAAIKSLVLGLVALDAIAAWGWCGPQYMLAILLLLVPAYAIGRYVYST